MKMAVTLPEYLPDQTSISGGLNVAQNVFPRIDGYGPVQGFSGFSDALAGPFNGGGAFIDGGGATTLLAGTTSAVYRYSSVGWVALATGLAAASEWRFSQFGEYVVAVTGAGTKVISLSVGTCTDLTGAPSGTSVAVVGDYVVIGQNSGDKLGIYTSAYNDHTDWDYASPTSTATYQPMLDGGEVMGITGGEYGVILQRQAIRRMSQTGDSTAPFQYDVVSNSVGCASKASVVAVGRTVYWLSDRGFMALSDGQGTPIPIGAQKVDRTFQASVNREDYERIFSCADPQNKTIIWCVPGTPGTLWIYNYELQRWSTASLVIDGLFPAFTASTTLEDLNLTYPSLDAMPFSLDDGKFTGGSPRLYVVSSGVMGTLSGPNLKATFEGGFIQPARNNVARLISIRPVTDAVEGNAVSFDCRARLGDAENIISASGLRASGIMPLRASGRYVKPKWTIAAGSVWSFAQGFDLEYEVGGER